MKPPSERLLFVVAALLTVFSHALLIAGPRRPIAPATREASSLQREYLLHPAEARSPLSCSGFLAGPLSLAGGPWVESRRRFHANFLLDELMLLVGSWLLARRHLRSGIAVFFAAVSAAGSSLFIDDPWRNVLPVRAIPLLLALLHDVLETGSRPKLFLAASLASAQALGNLPGTALVTPIAAALYFPALAWVTGFPLRERLRGLAGRRDLLLPLLGGLATALQIPTLLAVDQGGRPHEENGFLVTSTFGNPVLYLDAFLGLSPRLDASFFPGIFAAAFALAAVLEMPRPARLRLAAVLAATLAILGAVLALFPQGRTGTAGPVVRLLAAFLGGWGLDRFLAAVPTGAPTARKVGKIFLFLALVNGALSVGANQVAPAVEAFFHAFLIGGPPDFAPAETFQSEYMAELLGANTLAAAAAGGVLLLGWALPRGRPLALALLLVLHPLDVFSWKFRLTWTRSEAIGADYFSGEASVPRVAPPPPSQDAVRKIAVAGAGLHAAFWAGAIAVLLVGLAARRKEPPP